MICHEAMISHRYGSVLAIIEFIYLEDKDWTNREKKTLYLDLSKETRKQRVRKSLNPDDVRKYTIPINFPIIRMRS